jgi:hypothetical protein
MKKTTLIIILFFITYSYSQDSDVDTSKALKGKNALLFSIENLSLGSFNGGIGWKHWSSNSLAIISNITVIYSKDKKESTNVLMGYESSQKQFAISLRAEKHIRFINKLSPYIAGRFGFGYESIESKVIPSNTLFYYDLSYYENESKSTSVSLSLDFSFGIEYFLTDNIAISGQYNIGGHYKFGEEKVVSTIVEDTRDISNIDIGISSSSFIISIYL